MNLPSKISMMQIPYIVRLENEIIPLYYGSRNEENVPVEWVAKMKYCIRTLAPQFSMRRMLREYIEDLYKPAGE